MPHSFPFFKIVISWNNSCISCFCVDRSKYHQLSLISCIMFITSAGSSVDTTVPGRLSSFSSSSTTRCISSFMRLLKS
ncbi:hypothetical protein [Paenibacillus sp. Aloe-11]|uniref:hypothetical protein n=1 Tax=Paenibacillus sp. Aloe-11 TaxID=1050222 RepID=UPI003FA5BB39